MSENKVRIEREETKKETRKQELKERITKLISQRAYYARQYRNTQDLFYKNHCDDLTEQINKLRESLGLKSLKYEPAENKGKGRPLLKDVYVAKEQNEGKNNF